ncbi:MAG TPA: hypothetical protein VJ953_09265 [Saprospiraceae bacterium]|nr:hypothetical protein [Saprospiraceae bacterium]
MNYIKVVGIRKQWLICRFAGLLIGLFGVLNLSAQTPKIIGKSVFELRTETSESTLSLAIPHFLFPTTPNASIPDLRNFTTDHSYRPPTSYRYQDLAFFCRLEVKLEQSSKIPVRFRLGSVDYVDYMEGKIDRY